MTESYKNILLDVIGFIIVSFGIKTEDVFTTIFGLLLIFLDIKFKLNEVENKIEDLNIRIDNYKDIMQLNQEVNQIKKELGEKKK